MLNSLRAKVRSSAATFGRDILSPMVFRRFRRPSPSEDRASVHMLVSGRTWHAGLLAAISLEVHSGRQWRWFIHDDGSVTAEGRDRILSLLPGTTFVPRQEADQQVEQFFASHPTFLTHRKNHNLFLKFFDTLAFRDRDRFLVMDSDVIFFRKPEELLHWIDNSDPRCLYNEDTKEKFCIPREEIQKALGVDMLPRFNSGLVLMPESAVDFSWSERLLKAFEQNAHAPQFFEQTLWALAGSTNPGGGAPLPKSYNITWGYWREPGSICRHYVGDFKHDLLYIEGVPLLLAAVR